MLWSTKLADGRACGVHLRRSTRRCRKFITRRSTVTVPGCTALLQFVLDLLRNSFPSCAVVQSELSMGPFFVTQPNLTHQLTDPTQRFPLQVTKFGPNPTQSNTNRH